MAGRTDPVALGAQLQTVRFMTVGAGDTRRVHAALQERAVHEDLIQDLAVGVDEPAAMAAEEARGDTRCGEFRVAEIVESLDLHPIDLGPIANSRWIEGMAVLLIHNNFTPLPAFNFHLREVQ